MYCDKEMKLCGFNAYDQHKFSVDRIDNSKAHTKDNSQMCCLNCNIIKGNRY